MPITGVGRPTIAWLTTRMQRQTFRHSLKTHRRQMKTMPWVGTTWVTPGSNRINIRRLLLLFSNTSRRRLTETGQNMPMHTTGLGIATITTGALQKPSDFILQLRPSTLQQLTMRHTKKHL